MRGFIRIAYCVTMPFLPVLYSLFPINTWNSFDLSYKILGYFCVLCSAYALLWLLNKLPYQSPVV